VLKFSWAISRVNVELNLDKDCNSTLLKVHVQRASFLHVGTVSFSAPHFPFPKPSRVTSILILSLNVRPSADNTKNTKITGKTTRKQEAIRHNNTLQTWSYKEPFPTGNTSTNQKSDFPAVLWPGTVPSTSNNKPIQNISPEEPRSSIHCSGMIVSRADNLIAYFRDGNHSHHHPNTSNVPSKLRPHSGCRIPAHDSHSPAHFYWFSIVT
jgi:hypothetical protein